MPQALDEPCTTCFIEKAGNCDIANIPIPQRMGHRIGDKPGDVIFHRLANGVSSISGQPPNFQGTIMLPKNAFDLSKITDWEVPEWKRHDYIHSLAKSMGFSFLGQGRHRMTFLAPHKRFVIKFPKNHSGLLANRREDKTWSKYLGKPNRFGVQYAPCRLIQKSILMMRTVFNLGGDTFGCTRGRRILGGRMHGVMPYWADEIECAQIGKLPGGKIVAYDYAE